MSSVMVVEPPVEVLGVPNIKPVVPVAFQNVAVEHGGGNWWAQVDSNYRPRPYQGRALTN